MTLFDIIKFIIIKIMIIFEIMFKKTFEIMFKKTFEIITKIIEIKVINVMLNIMKNVIINKIIIDIIINFLKIRLI